MGLHSCRVADNVTASPRYHLRNMRLAFENGSY
jgi:hypothetical protein